jgi:hypothetical protein
VLGKVAAFEAVTVQLELEAHALDRPVSRVCQFFPFQEVGRGFLIEVSVVLSSQDLPVGLDLLVGLNLSGRLFFGLPLRVVVGPWVAAAWPMSIDLIAVWPLTCSRT